MPLGVCAIAVVPTVIANKTATEYLSLFESFGFSKHEANLLAQTNGYGNKKNLILLEALRLSADQVIFWDGYSQSEIIETLTEKDATKTLKRFMRKLAKNIN